MIKIFRHPNHVVYTLYTSKKPWKGVNVLKLKQYPKYYIYSRRLKRWFINFKLLVDPCLSFKYFKFCIRLPFFVFTKDNCNIHVGCNRLQLWIRW